MQVYQLQCWTLRCLWGSSEGRFWSPQGMSDWCWERPMGTLQNILAHLLIHVDYFSSFSKRCGPDELNLPKRGWCASKRIDQAHWSVAVLKLCSKCLFKWCSKIVYIVAWHIRNHTTTQHAWIALILESFIMNRITHTYGYGSIPIDTFLMGWTSIYQLFCGSLGVPGFWLIAILISNQHADDQQWTVLTSPFNIFQPCVQWPTCQEALLRGNATKELEAVQQAAAEARHLLETTPDLGKCVGDKAKNVSSNYSIFI